MNCEICLEPFNNSSRKPYKLIEYLDKLIEISKCFFDKKGDVLVRLKKYEEAIC